MIDLHIHTTFSDGTYSPTDIIKNAFAKNLKTVAITDHDTIDGLEEGRKEAKKFNLNFINGIELSTDLNGREVHILGYFINDKDEVFKRRLKHLKDERINRTKMVLDKLNSLGIEISLEDVMAEVTSNLVSRTHIATALLKKGYVKDRNEAFDKYIGAKGAAYIPKKVLTPFKAIEILKENGAITCLAHPKLMKLNDDKFYNLLDKLIEVGLDGIETYYPGLNFQETKFYKNIAKKRGLILTGGSDFHGLNKDGINLGEVSISNDVYKEMLIRRGDIVEVE